MRRQPMFMAVVALLTFAGPAAALFAEECTEGDTCVVELPGAVCGDGTQMFMNVTLRAGASRLYVYLQSGGACWDKVTCACGWDGNCTGGTAATLTRPPANHVRSGWRDPNVSGNPINADYNIVEVPYCSGDLFMGNKLQKFGGRGHGLRQFGYHNLSIALGEVKKRFPSPEAIVLMGSSAGGIGAAFNLHQVRREYPTTPLSLIADSGTPFKAPYVHQDGMDRLVKAWSLRDNIPSDYPLLVPGPMDLSGIIKYNAMRYPEHNYALISSYDDLTMNSFAILVGSHYGFFTVHSNINDFADHDLGGRQKVFYLTGSRHTFHELAPAEVVADGVNLGDWLSDMLEGHSNWTNQRANPGLAPALTPQ